MLGDKKNGECVRTRRMASTAIIYPLQAEGDLQMGKA
jgi:hypothetical protein